MIRKKMNYTSSEIKINKNQTITYVIFSLFTSFCILIFFSGCKTPSQKVEISKPPVVVKELPSPPGVKLKELVLDKIEEEKDVKRLFSLIIRDQDIGQVLLALSRQVPYNIVVNPDVSGKITIDLKEVTLIEALDTLTSLLEFEYEIKGKNIRVSLPKMDTRIFTLNYINTTRKGTGKLEAITGISGFQGGGGGGAQRGRGGSTVESDSGTTDLWEEIEEGLKAMISEKGKLIINKLANMVMVTDLPINLIKIAEFLEMIEGSTHRQVLIHAKIVEVSLFDKYKMGLDWNLLRNIGGLTKGNLTGGMSFAQVLNPGTGVFQVGVSSLDFSAILDAMSEQGQLDILSSPKISTLNNQKAVIKVGRDEIFFEPEYDPITTTDPLTGQIKDSRSVLSSVEPRTITVGVVLDVTPQISSDGYITMNIHPSITELVRIEEFRVGGEVFASAPVIDIRETDTVVRVRDGQAIVIAGMMQEKKTETVTKSPLLGSIPGLGALFRKTDQELRKTELVILITPTIMVGRRIDNFSQEELSRLEKTKREYHLGILRK